MPVWAWGGAGTTREAESERARGREVVENNNTSRAAEPVRLGLVIELCAWRAARKGLLRHVVNPPARVSLDQTRFPSTARMTPPGMAWRSI